MPKVTISQEFLHKLKPPTSKSKEQYFDTELIGFMLEVKPTGTKTYYYRYREQSKQKMIRIGTTKELTLEEAKKSYYELKESKTKAHTIVQPQEPQINPITFQQFV